VTDLTGRAAEAAARFLRHLNRHIDYLSGRYLPFLVETDEDLAACLAVLEQVRSRELNRVHGSSVIETAAFADEHVDASLIGVRDRRSGEVVGCIRRTAATSLAGRAGARAEYLLDRIDPALLPRAQVFTRLVLLPEHRRSVASLVLFQWLSADSLANGVLLSLQACEPGLYPGYQRLGFRPLGHMHPGASGGFRIPLVHVHHDLAHLEACRSPLAKQVRALQGPLPDEGLRWFRAFEETYGPIDCGVSKYSGGDEVHRQLTRGLSAEGVDELLGRALEVQCRAGDLIVREGDGGRFMGIVVAGAVEVRSGERALATLGAGELFGEMSVVLDRGRTASLVAAGDDTRVLTLSRSALERLGRVQDREQVFRNLAAVLAWRLNRAAA